MIQRVAVLVLLLAFMAASASAQEGSNQVIKLGERASLKSAVLNEERPYFVYLPPSYGDATSGRKRYPVLYLLDGDAHFLAACGVAQFMSSGVNRNLQIPEMIVVAIPNTNRTRDLTPTRSTVNYEGKEAPYLASSGGGDAFLRFLKGELIPRIDSVYRTLPYRVLVGHSLGGLFALHALVASPETFNAYIAIDPSLWWDNQVVLHRAESRFKDAALRPRTSVYIAMANTPGFEPGDPRFEGATRRFARLLQSTKGVRCTVQYFGEENHGSVPLLSLYHGLSYLFEGYNIQVDADRMEPADLAAHFKRVSERLGVTLLPPENAVNDMGYYLLYQANNVDKAVGFFRLNVVNYPDSSNAYDSLAEAYAVMGDTALAVENLEKALKLNPANAGAAKRLRDLKGPGRSNGVRTP